MCRYAYKGVALYYTAYFYLHPRRSTFDQKKNIYIYIYIKTHGSESRGQEEAGLHNKPVSYLQVALL